MHCQDKFIDCVNYRYLNAERINDTKLMPTVQGSLEGLKQATWYTTLDLKAGFYNVLVQPAS